jgi:hypothetical protein
MATYTQSQTIAGTFPSLDHASATQAMALHTATIVLDHTSIAQVKPYIALPSVDLDHQMSLLGINNIIGAVMHKDVGSIDTDYTAQANEDTANDVQLLPTSPASNDGFYIGYSTFPNRVVMNIGTAGVGTWTLTWYYWNGSVWSDLSSYILQKSPVFLDFKTAGLGSMNITKPSNCATKTISSISAYWIFAKLTYSSKTTIPLATRIYADVYTAPVQVMKSTAWKQIYEIYVMKSGVWKMVTTEQVMKSSTWKSIG